jgi:integrase
MAKRRRRVPGTGGVFRRKADGRWIAQVTKGPRGDRKTVRRYAPLRDNTRAKAKELLEKLQGEVAQPTSSMSLGDYLARWVDDARDIRPTTRNGYRAVVTFHLTPALGDVPLRDLTPAHVDRLLADLAGTMAPKTARNVHVVLRRALGQALRAGLVTRNVASREFVDAPKVPIVDPDALSTSEVRALLEACRGDRLEALFVVAVGTGLRQGELLGLAWEDLELDRVVQGEDGVDRPAPVLHVRKELVYWPAPKPAEGKRRPRGRYTREDPKTERSKRVMPLAPPVVDALRAQKDRLKAEGFIPIAPGPVFVSPDGAELSGSWVTHHFYRLASKAGLKARGPAPEIGRAGEVVIPFKILRATFSSRLFEAGVPDVVIARLMGHVRTHTTKRHYIADRPEAAVDAIARLVG